MNDVNIDRFPQNTFSLDSLTSYLSNIINYSNEKPTHLDSVIYRCVMRIAGYVHEKYVGYLCVDEHDDLNDLNISIADALLPLFQNCMHDSLALSAILNYSTHDQISLEDVTIFVNWLGKIQSMLTYDDDLLLALTETVGAIFAKKKIDVPVYRVADLPDNDNHLNYYQSRPTNSSDYKIWDEYIKFAILCFSMFEKHIKFLTEFDRSYLKNQLKFATLEDNLGFWSLLKGYLYLSDLSDKGLLYSSFIPEELFFRKILNLETLGELELQTNYPTNLNLLSLFFVYRFFFNPDEG